MAEWRKIVATNTIDAALLQKMFLAGAKNLEAKKEWINDLNVFPVPDGDTGTNMTLTIMSAAKEVGAIAVPDMETLAKAIATGSLRGARGNSGVILSQLLEPLETLQKIQDPLACCAKPAMPEGAFTSSQEALTTSLPSMKPFKPPSITFPPSS